jgi:hypothetical protein
VAVIRGVDSEALNGLVDIMSAWDSGQEWDPFHFKGNGEEPGVSTVQDGKMAISIFLRLFCPLILSNPPSPFLRILLVQNIGRKKNNVQL